MTDTSPLIEAQEKFQHALTPNIGPQEILAIEDCLGRVTATDVNAPMDSPPYPRSIVEGFVVHSGETQSASEASPVSFSIIGSTKPGDPSCPTPNSGQGIEVATGSIVPAGDYAIVRMWEAKRTADTFSIERPFPPGFFIEAQGCDIQKGSKLVAAGHRLTAKDIGNLASLGICEVAVVSKPRVAIFASGNEVIPHNQSFRAGAIFDCNSPMLAAAVSDKGCVAVKMGIQDDNFENFVIAVKQALASNDMILIAGGTAVDGRDFISDLIKEVGELIIDGVPMRSGRPLIMGKGNDKPIVCVAGHPPEALRGFEMFGDIAINRMLGVEAPLPGDPNGEKS